MMYYSIVVCIDHFIIVLQLILREKNKKNRLESLSKNTKKTEKNEMAEKLRSLPKMK